MKSYTKYIVVAILLYSRIIKAISLNMAVYTYLAYTPLYNDIVNEFNLYSKKNNLDISLNLTLFSDENTTYEISDFASTIEYLLKKKSQKYDIYIYDVLYTRKYSKYLIDLNEYLPEEHLNLYRSGDSLKVGVYDNKWVGLPIFLKYDILYSNMEYLQKYNKNVPKTWDELIETAKYILEQERKININSQLIGYNGLFTDFENSMCSLYEFLYSFRDTVDSPIPSYRSDNALKALNKLDEIKKEISSEQIFRANEGFNSFNLFNGNMLFMKFWDLMGAGLENRYKMTVLPGKKPGINGSCIGGYNIGIANFVKTENINASVKVLQFITSPRQQKNIIVNKYKSFTALTDLYNDQEVCSVINCDFARDVQSIHRPSNNVEDYDSYANKVKDYLFDFLYKNQPASDTLKNIDDITRVYNYSPETKLGICMLVIITITAIILLYSFIMIPIKKYKVFNKFFTHDQWIMYCLGTLLCLCSEYTKFGELSNSKCQYGLSMFLFGVTFNIIPVLYKLITYFPEKNEIKKWLALHKNAFVIMFVGMEVLFNGLLIYSPFSIETRLSGDNKNFSRCTITSVTGDIIMLANIIFKIFLIISILVLVFVEWNMKIIYQDIRAVLFTVYLECLVAILLIIINYIRINNYNVFYTIHSFIIILFSLSNYIYVYIIRILMVNRKSLNNNHQKLKEATSNEFDSDNNQYNTNSTEESIDHHDNQYNCHPNLFSRIINYHYNPDYAAFNTSDTDVSTSYNNITTTYSSDNLTSPSQYNPNSTNY